MVTLNISSLRLIVYGCVYHYLLDTKNLVAVFPELVAIYTTKSGIQKVA